MNLVGKVIGNRYEILEKVGEGGMATVYKARCNILKRYVAVKVLRDEFTTDIEFIKRFNIEAQSAASLTHPNIVSIFDVGHEDNIYYIVMELIQGKTLKEIITDDGTLPWKWSANIAIQVASALETAHKNGVVHRDIKPHNIIITEDGIAKVTDFGIAKAVSNSTITAFGTTIGSVHYFSPEHARGGYTDAKSDLYSLGVVMYEMLTGRVPFDADTPVSVALKHMQEKPVEPMKLNPSIPYAVNKIIMKLMEKDTSLRYQNATEVLKDLSLALKNPEGDFVSNNAENMQFTQRIPTLNEESLNEEANKTKNMKNTRKKDNKLNIKKKKIILIIIIVLIIMLLPIIGFFSMKYILEAGKPKDIEIYNLVGLTLEEAKEKYQGLNIQIESEQEFNEEVEKDKIISQVPPYSENGTIKENSTIKVTISKGIEMVEMPKVVGKTFEEAETKLKDELHLEIEKIEETSKTVKEGYVTKQEIEPGENIKVGTKVKIFVSKGTGIKEVSVPYVIGETEEDAKNKLKDLDVTVVYEEDTTRTEGRVLKQSIEAGKTVDEKSKITITINRIEKMKQGTIKVNFKSLLLQSVLKDKAEIKKDEEGKEIEETTKMKLVITANGDTIYSDSPRKDATEIKAYTYGKGTVTIKVQADGVNIWQGQLNLSSENPILNIPAAE